MRLVFLGATIYAFFVFLPTVSAPAIAKDYLAGIHLFYSPRERLDKLFDAILGCYPEVAIEEIDTQEEYYEATQIDYSKLKALERRFGDMPEYWEARWAYLDGWSELGKEGRGKRHSEWDVARLYNEILFKAVELSKRAPHYLFLYITNYRPETEEESLKFEEISADRLKEVIAKDFDEATYHYYRAYSLWKIGEIEEALQEFDAGNRAGKFTDHSLMFPRNYAVALSEELAEKPEAYEPLKAWRILNFLIAYPTPNYMKLKDIYKEALVAFNLSGDCEMLNTLQRHAVRMGTKKWAPRIERLQARVLIGILADGALDSGVCESLSSADARGYYLLGRQLGRLEAILTMTENMPAELESFFSDIETGEETRFAWDPAKTREFIAKRVEGIRSEFQLDPRIEHIFERLGKFDYANPAGFWEVMAE